MPFVPVQGGDTGTASTPVLLSTTPVPLREEPESSQASAVASTLGTGIGGIGAAAPSSHDWAKLLHWKRVLLLERQVLERQMQNQQLLASTLVRALTAQTELGRAAPTGFVSPHHMDNNPDARTMRVRALAAALLQNLNSV
jgi:hypothetical protein